MDNNIGLQVKRLIEIDRKAVELAEKRELELKELAEKHKLETDKIYSMLALAKEEAKNNYNEQLQKTQEEAEQLTSEVSKRLVEIEKAMSQTVEELGQELWSKVLDSIK